MIPEPSTPTNPCDWCGTATTSGSELCSTCITLSLQIRENPELAARMVGYYSHLNGVRYTKITDDVQHGIMKAQQHLLQGKKK